MTWSKKATTTSSMMVSSSVSVPDNKIGALIEVTRDERETINEVTRDALLLRGGCRVENPAEGAEGLSGCSPGYICREFLRITGREYGGSRQEIIGRALQSSDFTGVLANVATVRVVESFNAADETFEVWTGEGSLPDFKESTLARASEADGLDEIKENGVYGYGDMSDKKETVQMVTFGKILAITRQAFINDSMHALTDPVYKMGRAAKRKIGDAVYSVLTANAAMGDGVTLFHAKHSNVGTSGALGVTTVAEAVKLMGVQTDPSGSALLNLRPHFFIAPKALEGAGEVFFRSEKFADQITLATDAFNASTRVNPYAGSYFTRVYDARLDGSDTAKYYFAGPKGMTVDVFYLNGVKEPYIEARAGWTIDGTEFKVRIDAAAKAVDWVALVSNAGG
jgi:hypothetical protein